METLDTRRKCVSGNDFKRRNKAGKFWKRDISSRTQKGTSKLFDLIYSRYSSSPLRPSRLSFSKSKKSHKRFVWFLKKGKNIFLIKKVLPERRNPYKIVKRLLKRDEKSSFERTSAIAEFSLFFSIFLCICNGNHNCTIISVLKHHRLITLTYTAHIIPFNNFKNNQGIYHIFYLKNKKNQSFFKKKNPDGKHRYSFLKLSHDFISRSLCQRKDRFKCIFEERIQFYKNDHLYHTKTPYK